MAPELVLPSIDSLPAEILTEVLLRVPTPAALVHAAAASKIWRGFVADGNFLARYRERHRCSPFLGLYVPRQFGGAPAFHVPDSIRSAKDRDFKDAAKRAYFGEIGRYQDHRLHDAGEAFVLGDPGVHKPCRVLDCHNSRLLLTRGHEALEVQSPLTRETILLPFPPHVVHPDNLKACLLQGHGHDEAAAAKAFRVVFLQHRRQGRNWEARAVEYDSRRKSWQEHPWETLQGNIVEGTPGELMRAGHRLFCKYTGRTTSAVALLLDASDMRFFILALPNHQNFAIGELDDNRCCFVESDGIADHRLKVWQLDENRLDWVLKKDIRMDQVLGENVGYYSPCLVSNGMALMCSRVNHHFVVDLNTYSVKGEFDFIGQSAYFMQMPWPPNFSRPMTNVMNPGSSEDGNSEIQHEVRDGAAPLNCMLSNEPQYLDTPAAAEQCFAKVPPFYEPYMKEMNEHIEHDIDKLNKAMAVEYKLKCKAICQKRMAEMIAKISKGPCSTCNAASEASTSGAMPPDSSVVLNDYLVPPFYEPYMKEMNEHIEHDIDENVEKPVFPTDNDEVQQDTMENLVNESETGNLPKSPNLPHCADGEGADDGGSNNHDLEDVCASFQLLEMDHVHVSTSASPDDDDQAQERDDSQEQDGLRRGQRIRRPNNKFIGPQWV